MKAEIIFKTEDKLKINWEDDKKGFGDLNMHWDEERSVYILDSEFMNISSIIEIFKTAEMTTGVEKRI